MIYIGNSKRGGMINITTNTWSFHTGGALCSELVPRARDADGVGRAAAVESRLPPPE